MNWKLVLFAVILACSKGHATQQNGDHMKNKRVLISGGGVAGLTLAYWLKQHGFTPCVIERHPTLRTWGYKLDIRGSAIEVIKRMGIHDLAVELKSDTQGATMLDSYGNEIPNMDPDVCGGRTKEDLELLRSSLMQLLFKQVGEIEYLFGDSIKKIEEVDNEVLVEFEKANMRHFDLVIGADGLHSDVRKQVFGEESLYLKDLGFYVSYFTIPNYLNLDRWEIEYHAPSRFIIMYSSRNDSDAVAGFAFTSEALRFDPRNISSQKALIKEAFSTTGWQAPKLLQMLNDTPNFYFDCAGQIHMPSWSKGRVALLGDAAYAPSPVSGQGTSLAICGAYVLAQELAKAEGEYKKAFSEYEKKMRPFVKSNQGLVDLSVALMTENDSFLSSLNRYMQEHMPNWGTLVKELNAERIHKAATSLELEQY